MKIAIHKQIGSFSDYWIEYCESHNIEYTLINAYDSNVMERLRNFDVFMWHHHHANYKDILAARPILFSLEQAGIKVFPDFNSGWHFDDKVAQKYLLESISAPLVPSYVFYDEASAQNWARSTTFPKIFKLKGGAGASNVRMVSDLGLCKKLIRRSFKRGFSLYNTRSLLKDGWNSYRKSGNLKNLLKPVYRFLFGSQFIRMSPKQKGYIYFQDFIPNNDGDYRLIVINQMYAYGMKRMNRKNDFRASGSSSFVYDAIPDSMLVVAFEVSKRLKLQCVAFDFVLGVDGKPLIVEMSYGFGTKGSSKCGGYWTSDLVWHEESFNPFGWMVSSLIKPM